jgi:hypothetical protein
MTPALRYLNVAAILYAVYETVRVINTPRPPPRFIIAQGFGFSYAFKIVS